MNIRYDLSFEFRVTAPLITEGCRWAPLSLPRLPSYHLLNVLAFVQLANKSWGYKKLSCPICKQEVLRRTNSVLPFDATKTA
jgi:hypothetical protein